MSKYKNAIISLIAVATTVSVALPGNAQNFSDIDALINGWLNNYSSYDLAPSQASVRANVETRHAQLASQINAEIASGKVSASEAAELRSQLAQLDVQIQSSLYSGSGLSIAEVRDILTGIRTLASNVNTAIANNNTEIGGGTSVNLDFRASINDLRARINTARNLGQLRRGEANRLTDSLAWIRQEANRMSYNGLSASERRTLNNYIATVESRFEAMTEVAVTPDPAVTNRLANLRSRINASFNSGTITRHEFNDLNASLNWIANQHNFMLRGGLSGSERSALDSYLLTVNARFNSYGDIAHGDDDDDHEFDLSADIDRVRAQINRRLANGRITAMEARQLTRELDQVMATQDRLELSGGAMTSAEFDYLRRMLSSVERSVRNYM